MPLTLINRNFRISRWLIEGMKCAKLNLSMVMIFDDAFFSEVLLTIAGSNNFNRHLEFKIFNNLMTVKDLKFE